MILPLAFFVQTATDCAPQVAWQTLKGIAAVESGFNPFAIHINEKRGPGQSLLLPNKQSAVAKAEELISQGKSIDAGLMGINLSNWRWLGLNTETVFEPCQNLRAAAEVLTLFSQYNTGSPTRGFRNGYVQSVVRASYASDISPKHGSRRSYLARVVAHTRIGGWHAPPSQPPAAASAVPPPPPEPSWSAFSAARSSWDAFAATSDDGGP